MHYLIDGHNLIAKLPDIDLSDSDDEIELILRLKSWAAASRKRKVTLYFDGGLPSGVAHRLSTSDIQVVFAPERKTADSLIIRRIRKLQNPSEYTLVTSDQEIIDVAHKRRLPHLRSEEFAAQMGQDQQKRQTPPPPETDDPQISSAEVNEWLDLFGPEPEIPAKLKPSKRAPQSKPKPKAKRPLPRRNPGELKRTEDKLNADEVDEWLGIFTNKD